jgi:hypothetical protein
MPPSLSSIQCLGAFCTGKKLGKFIKDHAPKPAEGPKPLLRRRHPFSMQSPRRSPSASGASWGRAPSCLQQRERGSVKGVLPCSLNSAAQACGDWLGWRLSMLISIPRALSGPSRPSSCYPTLRLPPPSGSVWSLAAALYIPEACTQSLKTTQKHQVSAAPLAATMQEHAAAGSPADAADSASTRQGLEKDLPWRWAAPRAPRAHRTARPRHGATRRQSNATPDWGTMMATPIAHWLRCRVRRSFNQAWHDADRYSLDCKRLLAFDTRARLPQPTALHFGCHHFLTSVTCHSWVFK